MVKHRKYIFIVASLFLVAAIILPFFSKKGGVSSQKQPIEDQYTDGGIVNLNELPSDRIARRSLKRQNAASKSESTILKVDRSTPEKAYLALIGHIRNRNFRGYYESFSKDGRKALTGGRNFTEEDIIAMDEAFKRAGFTEVIIESQTVQPKGELVEVVGEVVSTRNTQSKKERIAAVFENISGEWLVFEFTAVPVTEEE